MPGLAVSGGGSVGLSEAQVSKSVRVSPMRNLGVVQMNRLAGTNFESSAKDTTFWTEIAVNSGTVTQSGGSIVISTAGGADRGAQYQTVRYGRYVAGQSNMFRGVVLCPDGPGTANNTKRWGAFTCNGSPAVTPLNGAYFEVSGTTMNVVTVKNGTPAAVPSANWTGRAFTLDTNAHTYEIWWTNTKVYFFIDDVIRHIVDAGAASWSDTLTLPATLQCLNTGGSSTAVTLEIRVASIYRLGHLSTEAQWQHIAGTVASTQCKLGAGRLHKVVINAPGAVNDTITLFDNTSATGTVIAAIKFTNNAALVVTTLVYDLPFYSGLFVATSGANLDITVIYE